MPFIVDIKLHQNLSSILVQRVVSHFFYFLFGGDICVSKSTYFHTSYRLQFRVYVAMYSVWTVNPGHKL